MSGQLRDLSTIRHTPISPANKATRAERTIVLRHGEKMLFGANRDKGLVRGERQAESGDRWRRRVHDRRRSHARRTRARYLAASDARGDEIPRHAGGRRRDPRGGGHARPTTARWPNRSPKIRNSNPIRCNGRPAPRGRDVGDRINAQSPMKNGGGGRRMSAAPVFLRTVPACGAPPVEEKESTDPSQERKNRKLRFITGRTCLLPGTRSTTDDRFRRRRIFRHARFRHARRSTISEARPP